MQSINAKMANMKREVTPLITVSSVRGNPKALTRTRDIWRQANVRITQSITTGTNIILGSIVSELGFTDVCQVKVRGVKIWNATGPATTTNYVFAETAAVLTTSSVRREAQDYGSGSQLAGVRFTIPGPLQASNGASNLQQTVALFITASATGSEFAPQAMVMDWDILYNHSADQ
jgi:hypothetical protein